MMQLDKITVVICCLVLLVGVSLVSVGANESNDLRQYGELEGRISDQDLVVDDLTVNAEEDSVVVAKDEPVVITATVTNQGDEPVDVPLIVEGAEDEEGHKGYVLEDLEPGESEDIEWTRDEHGTWSEGEYTIRVGDETVDVTVGESDDETVEEGVDWGEIRIIVGLVIAAFIGGIAVGVLWMKQGLDMRSKR